LNQNLFLEKLSIFKQEEKPESVLLVAEDQLLIKIVIAWTNIGVTHEDTSYLEPINENDIWDWLWKNTHFNLSDIKTAAGISITELTLENKIKHLIANRIIYPDGSINSFVQRYIREKVLSFFTVKKNRLVQRNR
jgi:hypothetical protein